jgi:hypothetical protein
VPIVRWDLAAYIHKGRYVFTGGASAWLAWLKELCEPGYTLLLYIDSLSGSTVKLYSRGRAPNINTVFLLQVVGEHLTTEETVLKTLNYFQPY